MPTIEAPFTLTVGRGRLRRIVAADCRGVRAAGLTVDGADLLSAGKEFVLQCSVRLADGPPALLRRENAPAIETEEAFEDTDTLAVTGAGEPGREADTGPGWSDPHTVDGASCCGSGSGNGNGHFRGVAATVERERSGIVRHIIEIRGCTVSGGGAILTIRLIYEDYPSDPAIRKRIEIRNESSVWVKLERLIIDDIELSAEYGHAEALTPSERGAMSSIIAYGNADGTRGVVVCSEVPSALREMTEGGGTGYRDELFEWVLGPSETFASEPVFMYGFAGETERTGAGVSRALDRVVESAFVPFLERELGVGAAPSESLAPLWCTWSHFNTDIDEAIVREQAELAVRAGFKAIVLDMGWQRGLLGTEPDPRKFPDFGRICADVRSLGLRLGLWVSCFRDPDSKDMAALPDAPSLPLLKRRNGFGMSFASAWRHYYADDLAKLAAAYGIDYFKQDFTNIQFGDRAEGHDSRTLKESRLRGLRGLLEAQRTLTAKAPGIVAEITHEIYWGTPGTPCDIAALRHAGMYHIPPNDYSGAGNRRRRYDSSWPFDPAELRKELIRGCFNARQRLYGHRGLPLRCLSYYAAATFNVRGSLTPDIQDRQICSWLMGAPLIFAGDLSSLSESNIQHYRARFALLERLQGEYGIYRHFQFSGVPGPTDEDWHWWGKLNAGGEGAVVVLRGGGGADRREIAIPWAHATVTYRVYACLGGTELGFYTGGQLRRGELTLSLPIYGQELLELRKR